MLTVDELDCVSAVGGRDHIEAFTFKIEAQGGEQGSFIVDNENPRHW